MNETRFPLRILRLTIMDAIWIRPSQRIGAGHLFRPPPVVRYTRLCDHSDPKHFPEWRKGHGETALRSEAKPGKESEVEQFLRGGLAIVQEEPGTTVWFAIRLGPSTFGIFDAFTDESGRQAHFSGEVAAALKEKADLFAKSPVIEKVDVVAAKLSHQRDQACRTLSQS